MTLPQAKQSEDRSARPHRVIRLYPARYRREYGTEIAATLADVTYGMNKFGLWRETASVAGHALRMRTGLDSARAAGRTLAALVPYIVAVAASLSAAFLAVWPLEPEPWDGGRTYAPLAYIPWLALLGCLLTGRWAWVKACAASAVFGAALSLPLVRWAGTPDGLPQNLSTLLTLGVAAAAVYVAPPDLPPTTPRARRNTALTTLALGVPLLVASVTVFQTAAGPGITESARPDPVRVLLLFAPFVLAFPAALGLGRSPRGGILASAIIVAACALMYEYGLLASVPHNAGMLMAKVALLTGVAALVIRLVLRLRPDRERPGVV